MIKFPSLKNENPLTWKCKLFGCKNKTLNLIWLESEEKHGITGFSFATACTVTVEYFFKGCYWCNNFSKIRDSEKLNYPAWVCDCNLCDERFQFINKDHV